MMKKKTHAYTNKNHDEKNKEACSNAGGEKRNHSHSKINMLHKKRFQKVVQNTNLWLWYQRRKNYFDTLFLWNSWSSFYTVVELAVVEVTRAATLIHQSNATKTQWLSNGEDFYKLKHSLLLVRYLVLTKVFIERSNQRIEDQGVVEILSFNRWDSLLKQRWDFVR